MISVVIPLYNKAHTIVNTLNTVFNQTYKDFEVIIINDGSTDNGVEVIKNNFSDKRIKIVNQENAGVSAARNHGILESKGDWISFLDGDDEWLPNYLYEINNAIKKYPFNGIIISGRFSQNFYTKKRTSNIPNRYLNKVSDINFFENPHVYFHISSTTIKSDVLRKNYDSWGKFIEGQKSNEDFTFIFRIALHEKVTYIGKPLSIYNGMIENQATSTLKENQILNDNILFNNTVISEYFNSKSYNRNFKIFMKYAFRHCLLNYLKNKNYKTIHYLLKGLNKDSRTLLIHKFEYFIYQTKLLNLFAIYYIYFTKLIWRTHNYPRVK